MSTDESPFRRQGRVETATPSAVPSADPILGPHLEAEGATAPSHAPLPDDWTWLGYWQLSKPAPADTLFLLAAHGGCGASTLQQVASQRGLHPTITRQWPYDPASGSRPAVVIVARTHARGLAAAHRIIHEWASSRVDWLDLLGLVLVADAPGRPPAVLTEKITELSALVPKTWTIGWEPSWRAVLPGETHTVPSRIKLTLGRIRRALTKHVDQQQQNLSKEPTTKEEGHKHD